MHAMGSTFGGVLISGVKGDYCRIRVMLNVQKSLRQGIFIEVGSDDQKWLPFKYENLPSFCFRYGVLGHTLINCLEILAAMKEISEDELPFYVALKAKLNLIGSPNFKLGAKVKKLFGNRAYLGKSECFSALNSKVAWGERIQNSSLENIKLIGDEEVGKLSGHEGRDVVDVTLGNPRKLEFELGSPFGKRVYGEAAKQESLIRV